MVMTVIWHALMNALGGLLLMPSLTFAPQKWRVKIYSVLDTRHICNPR